MTIVIYHFAGCCVVFIDSIPFLLRHFPDSILPPEVFSTSDQYEIKFCIILKDSHGLSRSLNHSIFCFAMCLVLFTATENAEALSSFISDYFRDIDFA